MDMILTSLFIGFGTCLAFLITTAGMIKWRGIAQHANKVDVFGTLLIYFMFAGTSTMGILVAMWAGLFIAIVTRIVKRIMPKAAALPSHVHVPTPKIRIKLER